LYAFLLRSKSAEQRRVNKRQACCLTLREQTGLLIVATLCLSVCPLNFISVHCHWASEVLLFTGCVTETVWGAMVIQTRQLIATQYVSFWSVRWIIRVLQ